MHRSTSGVRRACAVGTTIALVGLTAGLGVFGAGAAHADETPIAVVDQQPAGGGSTTTTPTGSTNDPSAAAGDAPQTGDGAAAGDAGQAADGSTTGDSTPAGDSTPSSDGGQVGDTTQTNTSGNAPTATSSTDQTPSADSSAADLVVTITGKARVGSVLTAVGSGFTGTLHYTWTVGGEPRAERSNAYPVTAVDAGKTVSVTVTADDDQEQSAVTALVTEDAAFTEGTDVLHPVTLSSTAGESVPHTFQATGFPAPEYELADLDDDALNTLFDSEDDGDSAFYGGWTFPSDLEIDRKTGELIGAPTEAGTWIFQVNATSGDTTASSYVKLTIAPSTGIGIIVTAADQESFWDVFENGGDGLFWFILPDGESYEIHVRDGETVGHKLGGMPHVDQGGVLSIQGSEVDQYFNPTQPIADDGSEPLPTVTSSVASDVITPNEDEGAVVVRFPHASTHTLTVAQGTSELSFPVTVNPTVAPVAVAAAAPTATRGQLAFTGSDDSALITWALGLLAAGVGVTGLRIARRRAGR